MKSIYPPLLTGTNTQTKREEIKKYFHNTYDLFEKIFEVLKNDDVFYKKSELTRHPMIFYFGHTATFFINKLISMKIIEERINPLFESVFAVGVDEMSWDDVDSKNYEWPSVESVRKYRKEVRTIIDTLIDEIPLTLPITQDSAMWIILMGIEHERIHIETSLVLHRQMPIEFVKEVEWFVYEEESLKELQNELINIDEREIKLGKSKKYEYYGWDNEYGDYSELISSFKTSKYLVSNKEFMEFVEDDGYKNLEYWDEEGIAFLEATKVKHPTFWLKKSDGYKYRLLNKVVDMPLNFPVEVNALEAEAFCRYKSIKDSKEYRLPSESEYRAIYEQAGLDEFHHLKKDKVNHNLLNFCSSPIDRHNFNGIYDVVGNVWQWSATPIFGFDGFEVHEAYDDFSVPTFDKKHALILGSSWASSGNLIMKYSRYAFRKHFFQNAGFRYVVSPNVVKQNIKSSYEDDVKEICYLDYLEDRDFSYILRALKYVNATIKALDFGCKTGRSSFELARYFSVVDGVDTSVRFIRVGVSFQKNEQLSCDTKEIMLDDFGYKRIKERISFKQANPENLKPNFKDYNFVVAKTPFVNELVLNLKTRILEGTILVTFELITLDCLEFLEEGNGFYIYKFLPLERSS